MYMRVCMCVLVSVCVCERVHECVCVCVCMHVWAKGGEEKEAHAGEGKRVCAEVESVFLSVEM